MGSGELRFRSVTYPIQFMMAWETSPPTARGAGDAQD